MKHWFLAIGIAAALCTVGCREEGPVEKAGRQIDETIDDMGDRGEGALERLGREVDEAKEQTREAAEEVGEAIDEATR